MSASGRRRILCIAPPALVFLVMACSFAQSQSTYDELLAAALAGENVDYVQLRATFARTDEYHPYGVFLDDLHERARVAAAEQDSALGVARAESLLAAVYPSLETQFWASRVFGALGDSVRADHHLAEFFRLLDAATGTGDGSSPDSSITVIYTGEEYLILTGIMGLEVTGQAIIHDAEHSYDRMGVRNVATGDTGYVFFNVDCLVATWDRLFGR